MTPEEQRVAATTDCRSIIREKSKSFAMASKLLPASSRDDVITLYAWCRRADDAIDMVPEAEQPAAIQKLSSEIESLYAGQAQVEPVLQLFQSVVQKYQIPKEYPLELIAGMQMDADGMRYQTLHELLLYCYRVAGVVGLMLCHILGVRNKTALSQAAHLGIAMQLTNIARDVAEDWARARLYIPHEWLTAQVQAPELHVLVPSDVQAALKPQIQRLLDLADNYYSSADRGIPALPYRAALAVAAARRVYSAIGAEIRAAVFDVFSGRIYVSNLRKLWLCGVAIVSTTLAFVRLPSSRGVPRFNLPVKAVEDVIYL